MALSSFGKILTVLDLFSVSRPVINVDIICEELGLSKPTSYRYLKELVSSDILQRISGTSGDYTLGSKIAVLDYISRTTDPVVQASSPFMSEIAERTELCCLLTHLNQDYCIDVHHEVSVIPTCCPMAAVVHVRCTLGLLPRLSWHICQNSVSIIIMNALLPSSLKSDLRRTWKALCSR